MPRRAKATTCVSFVVSALMAMGLMPGAGVASPICDAPRPTTMPTCTVGVWAGQSDMAEKMRAILERMPASVRDSAAGSMNGPLGMVVFEDGYYATMPVQGGIEATLGDGGGDAIELTMDMAITPALGWLDANDAGAMQFCTMPGTGIPFATATVSGPGGSTTAPIGPAPGGGFVPRMTYTCAGDQMEMKVMLPEPVGTVTYSMRRVPEALWAPDLRDRIERRFAE